MAKEQNHFSDYKSANLTKPRDLAWGNFAKFEEIGDKAQGYIVDVFYKKPEGAYKESRGITLKQTDGQYVNVAIKRLPFILRSTDDLRLGDPLTVEFEKELPSKEKGLHPTKVLAFYGKSLPENKGNKTVKELEAEDFKIQTGTDILFDETPVPEANQDVSVEPVPFK